MWLFVSDGGGVNVVAFDVAWLFSPGGDDLLHLGRLDLLLDLLLVALDGDSEESDLGGVCEVCGFRLALQWPLLELEEFKAFECCVRLRCPAACASVGSLRRGDA